MTVTPIPYQLVKETEAIASVLPVFWLQDLPQPSAGLTGEAFILSQAAQQIDPLKFGSSDLEASISKTIARDVLVGF